MTLQRWFSEKEAAEYLGVSERSIRRYVSDGRLPARQVREGRTVRINLDHLDRLLAPRQGAGR